MAFNGTGTASLTPTSVAPAVSNTTISATDFNATTADIIAMFNKTLCRDGQANPTANLPMATFRHTGVGNAAAATDYAAAGQVQAGTMTYAATSVGTDAYAITVTPAIAAYTGGMRFQVLIDVANTGPCTLNAGPGAVAIKLQDGADTYTGAILATSLIDVIHDGTNFILMSCIPVGTPGTVEASKALVVDVNKDALGFRKITGSASSGYTAFFEYTGTTGDDYAVRGHVSGLTGGSYAVGGTNLSATGFGVRGIASHATGINYGGYFQSSSSAGYGLQAVTTVAGGIPAYIQSFDAADNNPGAIIAKGGRQLRLNPRSAAGGYNPVVPLGAQTVIALGPASAIDTGVLFIGPHATDAVGILMDSSTDNVTITGTTITLSGSVNGTTNLTGTFQLGGVAVTSSAAELNYSDITTLGTAQASKVLTLDASSNLNGTVTSATITTANVTTKLALTVATGATIIKRILGSTPIIAEATAFADANIYHDAYAAGALAVLYIGTAVATGDIRLNYTTNAVTSTVFSRIIKNGSFYDGFSNAGLGVETRNVLVPVVRGDIVTLQFYFATAGTHTVYNVNVSASTDTVGIV